MAISLKEEYFSLHFFESLASQIKSLEKSFNDKAFVASAKANISALELKGRMHFCADLIHECLPLSYFETLALFNRLAPLINTPFSGIVLPTYVEKYGLNNVVESVEALMTLTPYSTSEFAIRPYLEADFEYTLSQMLLWSKHENEHVRRLSSEGTRPKLPWGKSVSYLSENPFHAFPILENLKNDPSLYVRKSVGNHLNDISKLDPKQVCDRVEKWGNKEVNTNWIVNKGLRTLIKKGYPKAFNLIGYTDKPSYTLHRYETDKAVYVIGEKGKVNVVLEAEQTAKLNVDIEVSYVKSKGVSKKVFKLKSGEVLKGDRWGISKTLDFRQLSTRTHYPGLHSIQLLINGFAKDKISFELSGS